MHPMKRRRPVGVSCEAPGVGTGGYFNWLRRRKSGQGGPARRRFNPQEPNRLRRGDSACIRTDAGRLCPAAVIDLSGRQAVGRSLQPHMQTGPVKDAMAMARRRHRD